jgi:hypothetical protein
MSPGNSRGRGYGSTEVWWYSIGYSSEKRQLAGRV